MEDIVFGYFLLSYRLREEKRICQEKGNELGEFFFFFNDVVLV